MPLYDYRCTECAREVEVMHGIYDHGPERCEHCGGAMRKALSTPAIHFKGSGWAKKDAAAATAKKATPKAGTASDKSPSTGGDAKASGAETTATAATDSSAKSSSGSDATSKAAPTAGSKTD